MEQHLEALQRASVVRLARADLKRAVKAGEVKVAEVLLGEIPDWLEAMRLEELCNAIPRFGSHRSQRSMQRTQVRFSATVRDLTARKRQVVAEDLADFEADARRARRRSRARGAGARAKAAGI